jgi:hypothetical protein
MKEVEVVSDNRVSSQLALLGEEEERSRWISRTPDEKEGGLLSLARLPAHAVRVLCSTHLNSKSMSF